MNIYVMTQWGVAHRAHPESTIATWCGRIGVKSITHTDQTLADFARDAGAEVCRQCAASLDDPAVRVSETISPGMAAYILQAGSGIIEEAARKAARARRGA